MRAKVAATGSPRSLVARSPPAAGLPVGATGDEVPEAAPRLLRAAPRGAFWSKGRTALASPPRQRGVGGLRRPIRVFSASRLDAHARVVFSRHPPIKRRGTAGGMVSGGGVTIWTADGPECSGGHVAHSAIAEENRRLHSSWATVPSADCPGVARAPPTASGCRRPARMRNARCRWRPIQNTTGSR